jgi:Peptidase C39 family
VSTHFNLGARIRRMNRKRAFAATRIICLIGLAPVVGYAYGEGAHKHSQRISELNCGSLALLVMARLEGVAARPAALLSALPVSHRDGYSMREIQNAGRVHGLNLAGVRLPKGGRVDRPVLMFLQRENHGHYVIVRPVGHTGKLVQLIDPTRESSVVDLDSLYASSQWTGRALAPYRSSWTDGRAIGLVALLAAPLVFLSVRRSLPWNLRRRWRGTRPVDACG